MDLVVVGLSVIVLWDIDGTLVDVKGAGRRAFSRALERVFGIRDDLAHVETRIADGQ